MRNIGEKILKFASLLRELLIFEKWANGIRRHETMGSCPARISSSRNVRTKRFFLFDRSHKIVVSRLYSSTFGPEVAPGQAFEKWKSSKNVTYSIAEKMYFNSFLLFIID